MTCNDDEDKFALPNIEADETFSKDFVQRFLQESYLLDANLSETEKECKKLAEAAKRQFMDERNAAETRLEAGSSSTPPNGGELLNLSSQFLKTENGNLTECEKYYKRLAVGRKATENYRLYNSILVHILKGHAAKLEMDLKKEQYLRSEGAKRIREVLRECQAYEEKFRLSLKSNIMAPNDNTPGSSTEENEFLITSLMQDHVMFDHCDADQS